MGKITHRLYYCKICGEEKTRKKFDASARHREICKECYALPKGERNEILRVDRLHWLIPKYPKSREDWALLELWALNHKDKESGQIAQSYLEENSSHYKARVAKKKERQNRNQFYIRGLLLTDILNIR